MRLKRNERNSILKWSIIVSLCLHVLFLFVSPHLIRLPEKQDEEIVVEIDPELIRQWEKEQKLQIAQSERADNDLVPEDAKFFGKRNQTVEKQTKAKKVDDFKQAQRRGVQQPANLKKFVPKTLSPVDIGEFRKQLAQQRQAQPRQQRGSESATDDYLKDIAEGSKTLLSTKEYIYFGYFQRIRDRLKQNWNRRIRTAVMRHMQSGGRFVSQSEYITKVIVVLDRHGKIKKVRLEGKSGVNNLDDAAVDAFNAAGPFPNPPEGLVGEDGLITIPWHFILQS